MSFEHLLFTKEDGIAVITLNRPKALNALNKALLLELSSALGQVENDSSVHALILTGAGDKAFVAGADISEMRVMTPHEARAFARLGQAVMTKIERLAQPTIAAVNGYALGGGCELAMACDIRLASVNAKFGQPEVNLGVIAGFGGTQRLPRLVGAGIAKELLMTGDMISAERAAAIGLVNHVYEAAELLPKAKELAKKIAQKAPVAIRLSKQSVNEGVNMDIDRALSHEAELFALCFATEDQKEGMSAFLEKRSARFEGK
jgi:enoyl-CoA hydratase